MGISLEDDMEETDDSQVDISVDLDADYFKWKDEQETEDSPIDKQGKSDRFSGMFKGFGNKK